MKSYFGLLLGSIAVAYVLADAVPAASTLSTTSSNSISSSTSVTVTSVTTVSSKSTKTKSTKSTKSKKTTKSTTTLCIPTATATFDDLPVDSTPPVYYNRLDFSGFTVTNSSTSYSITPSSGNNTIVTSNVFGPLSINLETGGCLESISFACIGALDMDSSNGQLFAAACTIQLVSSYRLYQNAGSFSFTPNYTITSDGDLAPIPMATATGIGCGDFYSNGYQVFMIDGPEQAQIYMDNVVTSQDIC